MLGMWYTHSHTPLMVSYSIIQVCDCLRVLVNIPQCTTEGLVLIASGLRGLVPIPRFLIFFDDDDSQMVGLGERHRMFNGA